MKTGFWEAPEGVDAEMTLPSIGTDNGAHLRAQRIALLATADAEQWIKRCPLAANLLPRLVDALATQIASQTNKLFDISDFPPDDCELLSQVLGEGEVSGVATLNNGVIAQIQESVMAGLWRIRFTDASGRLIADYIEVGAIPQAVKDAAERTASELLFGAPPPNTMNVMPVLAEIRERMQAHRPGAPSHIITFSLFPMTEADMQFLRDRLGGGPVQLVSRGYGTCRIVATGARNVWSVQFFNAMGTIILDTLEIGEVPLAACAAEEDLRDSAERLREIEEAYFQ